MATVESSPVTGRDVEAARAAVETIARRTPVLSTRTISERAGGVVALKAENLQSTGSFKVRGTAAKLAALGAEGCKAGVVAASAGNHAQAVALAARTMGVPCEVFVPADAPIAKTEAARGLGAIVHLGGGSVDECLVSARERSREGGLAFIHPFDDPDVVAGQGSLGLELLEDVPDLAKVVVPVGGGGLCSGIAIAIKSARPDVEIVGVQVAACAPYIESLKRGEPVEAKESITIADGIAVKRPGELTMRLLSQWVDEVVAVGEDETAEAMVLLMERCKLVVEGAGAVGVAALLGGQVAPAESGTTVAVLSGGNVDPGLLASIARRHETEVGRRLVLLTRVPDRPGALAEPARLRRLDRREHRRRLARARGARPARARDRGRDGARDARARPRAARDGRAARRRLRDPGDPLIETDRLRLRPLRVDDHAALHALRSREDVVRWLYWDAPTEEQTRAWIEGILARPPETGTTFAVELRDSGELVGNVNVMVDAANRQGEIGFIFHPDHQGHGYATEASRALVDHAFEHYGLHRVYGRLEPRNAASARVLEKLGMRREAHLIENEWIKGEWQSEAIYGLLAREWAAANAARG